MGVQSPTGCRNAFLKPPSKPSALSARPVSDRPLLSSPLYPLSRSQPSLAWLTGTACTQLHRHKAVHCSTSQALRPARVLPSQPATTDMMSTHHMPLTKDTRHHTASFKHPFLIAYLCGPMLAHGLHSALLGGTCQGHRPESNTAQTQILAFLFLRRYM